MEKRVISINTSQPKFLVLAGDGINCERETARAFELANGAADICHVNALLEAPKMLSAYDGLAIPGGFSFGDELGSGQLLALKIQHQLSDVFHDFVEQKKPIIGICNGFQVLVRLGLLPHPFQERIVTLTTNDHGQFMNKWAKLETDEDSVCKWTQGLPAKIDLPVRHKEGRIILKPGEEDGIYLELKNNGQIPFHYDEDINGSYNKIAALCDPTGLILGMMPHPEAFVSQATYKSHHNNPQECGDGLFLFDNIIAYLTGNEKTTTHSNEGTQRHAS